jgi:hypothetical protein
MKRSMDIQTGNNLKERMMLIKKETLLSIMIHFGNLTSMTMFESRQSSDLFMVKRNPKNLKRKRFKIEFSQQAGMMLIVQEIK